MKVEGGLQLVVAGPCLTGTCCCSDLAGLPFKVLGRGPPFHDGCTCYTRRLPASVPIFGRLVWLIGPVCTHLRERVAVCICENDSIQFNSRALAGVYLLSPLPVHAACDCRLVFVPAVDDLVDEVLRP